MFSFQSWSKADGIKDVQLDGISIGDSALLHYSSSELNNGFKTYYPNKKFYLMDLLSRGVKYDGIQFAFKQNDKDFTVHQIAGFKMFKKKTFNQCLKEQKEIKKDISAQFKNLKINEVGTYDHPGDSTGQSKKNDIELTFPKTSESMTVECIDWSKDITKEKGWVDNLAVVLYSKEYENWLRNKAFD